MQHESESCSSARLRRASGKRGKNFLKLVGVLVKAIPTLQSRLVFTIDYLLGINMPSADPDSSASSFAPSKPFSLSLASKPKSSKSTSASPSNAPSGKKRPYSALADPDSEPEDDVNGRHDAVVGFGNDGKAISVADASHRKQPLVIKAEKSSRDWREETRRRHGKNLLPAEVQAQQNGHAEDMGNVEHSHVSTVGGLKVVQQQVDGNGDTAMGNTQINGELERKEEGKKLMTADEEAVAALLGVQKRSTLTIPATKDEPVEMNGHDHNPDDYTNEADRFRADVDSLPPPASLADYAAIPVEEFGAAILRGLGWKEGEAVGKRGQAAAAPREVKRRPALLGLGAKETPGGVSGEELGAWNQKKGKGRDKVAYNPLMLRNSVTGEMVTEEEMELRKLEAKQGKGMREEDWRERRDRNLRIDDGRKRERLAIQSSDQRSGSGSSRRDRSQDRDRYGERDRRRDRDDGSSRRERTRSREKNMHGSSRRERSRSMERKYRKRNDDDYDRRDRDKGSGQRDKGRDYDRGDRGKNNDRRNRGGEHRRY